MFHGVSAVSTNMNGAYFNPSIQSVSNVKNEEGTCCENERKKQQAIELLNNQLKRNRDEMIVNCDSHQHIRTDVVAYRKKYKEQQEKKIYCGDVIQHIDHAITDVVSQYEKKRQKTDRIIYDSSDEEINGDLKTMHNEKITHHYEKKMGHMIQNKASIKNTIHTLEKDAEITNSVIHQLKKQYKTHRNAVLENQRIDKEITHAIAGIRDQAQGQFSVALSQHVQTLMAIQIPIAQRYISTISGYGMDDDTHHVADMLKKTGYIGAEDWRYAFGVSFDQPDALPYNIKERLSAPCVIHKDRFVMDTHMLIWIPSEIEGRPLTLARFFQYYLSKINGDNKNNTNTNNETTIFNEKNARHEAHWMRRHRPGNGCWMLIYTGDLESHNGSTGVLPGTQRKNWLDQCHVFNAMNERAGGIYRKPMALEMIVSMVMLSIKTSKKILSDHPLTYTHCDESWSQDGWGAGARVTVGQNKGVGVYTLNGLDAYGRRGLGAMMPLF